MATSHALTPARSERVVRHGVLLYVALLVVVPLLVLTRFGFADGIAAFWQHVSTPIARNALWLTVWTSVLVGALNAVFGTATAWVLVRYRVPGRALLSALVDLPLAIPTLVAGVMLAILFGPTSMAGTTLAGLGVDVLYAKPGIVLALLFVTLPFVVRAVEPVLAEVDPAEEEAAAVLGAGPWRTFRTVFLPVILPAALSGSARSLGRAMGEFGSLVVVAGNIPFKTLTAPVFIFGEIESGTPHAAASVSVVLLALALAIHGIAHQLERLAGARHATA
jgi:sulfate transport system permease protein